jgi:hypothetical protein
VKFNFDSVLWSFFSFINLASSFSLLLLWLNLIDLLLICLKLKVNWVAGYHVEYTAAFFCSFLYQWICFFLFSILLLFTIIFIGTLWCFFCFFLSFFLISEGCFCGFCLHLYLFSKFLIRGMLPRLYYWLYNGYRLKYALTV